uniref:Putative glycine rich nucleic binding domain protein n=1 Tax=Culex tarsalis TaxID=7177 RepID=A0A1Q3FGI0_CULTA
MIVAKLFKTAGLVGHELPSIQQPQQLQQTPSDDSKYDPADVLDDTNLDELEEHQNQDNQNDGEPIQMQPNYYGDERHFYDDKSTTETDSDTEYVREARKRNLKNLKHKTMNAGNAREDASSSDSDEDFRDSPDSKEEGRGGGGGGEGEKGNGSGSGGRSGRQQKQRKKSRWGDQSESVETTDMTGEGQGFTEDGGCSGVQDDQQQLFHQSSRSNPGFLQFVFQNYGTVEVSPEAWKLAEEHFRIRLLYEDMSEKIQRHERYTSNRLMNDPNGGPVDVEEDRRMNTDKMKAILLWINETTKLYERCQPSSLRDFLMRDEFESFLDKFQTNETDRFPNFEDYKKFKLEQAKIVSTTSRGEYSSSDSAAHQNAMAGSGQMMADNAKRRKSRWGDQVPIQTMPNPGANQPSSSSNQSTSAQKLTNVNRTDPALLAYVRQNFGSTNLSEEDWKKAEDHYKINLLYQDMLRKRQEIDRLAASGKFKYEYDSDEDVTGGTWEHKLRSQEMEATQLWANELTKKSEGKHHIGDFLPPEELRKFMEKYDAQKNNRQPNLSDYKEYKLKEDNVGFQMLQKLGWKEGQGLGADGSGIVDPINKASQRDNNQGLGVAAGDNPEIDDNEYDQYRKRMMLAYRFRPNPLGVLLKIQSICGAAPHTLQHPA